MALSSLPKVLASGRNSGARVVSRNALELFGDGLDATTSRRIASICRSRKAWQRRLPLPSSVRTVTALCAASRLVAGNDVELPGRCASGAKRPFADIAEHTSKLPTLHVGIIGFGLVGKELAKQITSTAGSVSADIGVSIEIAAVARSKTMVLLTGGESGRALTAGDMPTGEEPLNLESLGKHLLAAASDSGGRALVVDNTASDSPVEFYEGWLAAGIDVVTPNKRAGSGPYARYEKIKTAAREGGSRFMYEATVGAGLPIIGPLQTLRRAGDEVAFVEGIFSGTLSYIFNTWTAGVKFSDVVAEAKAKGFTEPDPRDDLGGTDVQRKVVILARELGLKLELEDVPVQSLVPAKLRDWSPPSGQSLGDAFVQELTAYDGEMSSLMQEAEAANEVLRFVGIIDASSGTASVKLARYPKDHPFASTQFADNIVTFSTKWYSPRPLVVQGPGAGAAVTAAGIYGNVIEAMMSLKSSSLGDEALASVTAV